MPVVSSLFSLGFPRSFFLLADPRTIGIVPCCARPASQIRGDSVASMHVFERGNTHEYLTLSVLERQSSVTNLAVRMLTVHDDASSVKSYRTPYLSVILYRVDYLYITTRR